VPLPLLLLPSLAPQMQQKIDKPALRRSKMICFLSVFLSCWRELGSAHRIPPARQVQLDTAVPVLPLCSVGVCSADEVPCCSAGGDQSSVSIFLLGVRFILLEKYAFHRQFRKEEKKSKSA